MEKRYLFTRYYCCLACLCNITYKMLYLFCYNFKSKLFIHSFTPSISTIMETLITHKKEKNIGEFFSFFIFLRLLSKVIIAITSSWLLNYKFWFSYFFMILYKEKRIYSFSNQIKGIFLNSYFNLYCSPILMPAHEYFLKLYIKEYKCINPFRIWIRTCIRCNMPLK